jgi:hypothetical protein
VEKKAEQSGPLSEERLECQNKSLSTHSEIPHSAPFGIYFLSAPRTKCFIQIIYRPMPQTPIWSNQKAETKSHESIKTSGLFLARYNPIRTGEVHEARNCHSEGVF